MKNFPLVFETIPASKEFDFGLSIERISKWAETHAMSVYVNQLGENYASFSIKNTSYIFHNSFLPVVNMELRLIDNEWRLVVQFRLNKIMRIFVSIYIGFAIILQTMLLFTYITANYSFSFAIFIPTVLIAFALLILFIGLKISSKCIMKVIAQSME